LSFREENQQYLKKMYLYMSWSQGDQMSLWRNRPKCCPRLFLSKVLHNLNSLKSSPKMRAIFCNFQSNCPKLSTIYRAKNRTIWDRCYDFKNIFDEKLSEKIGVFCSNCCKFLLKLWS
jgi:hypothetical protein